MYVSVVCVVLCCVCLCVVYVCVVCVCAKSESKSNCVCVMSESKSKFGFDTACQLVSYKVSKSMNSFYNWTG